MYLDRLAQLFEKGCVDVFSKKNQKLKLEVSKLENLNPLAVMTRGFSVAKTEDGQVLRKIQQVKTGDKIQIMLNDGSVYTTVEKINRAEIGDI